jgi:hypothetical protein
LQTEFRASISLASQTELFLNHLDGHAYSSRFIQGHLDFLQKQGSKIQSELAGASAQSPDLTSLDALKRTTGELTRTLDDRRDLALNPLARASSISHLHSIRERLEADMPQ